MRLSFCIFAVAALFQGASSDIACMKPKVKDISLKLYVTEPVTYCNNTEQKFKRFREGLKTCTRHEIDIDGKESLVKELCTNGSDLRRDFEEHWLCLYEHHNISRLKCQRELLPKYGDISEKEWRNYRRAMELCNEWPEFLLNCMIEKVAKLCGEGGGKVYSRVIESWKPLLRTVCLDAADVKVPLDDNIDIWFADDDDIWVPASATSHSATCWSIAFGVLIAVMGADCMTFALSNVFGQMWNRHGAVHLRE